MRRLITASLFVVAFLGAQTASAHLIVDVALSAAAPAFVARSSPFVYLIHVTDLAYDNAFGVVVTDELPAGVKFVSAAGSGWNCSASGGAVTCSAEVLVPGDNPITLNATAPGSTGTIINNVNVQSIGSMDPVQTNDSASQQTVVYDPAACTSAPPALFGPVDAATPPSGVVTFAWSAVPGATKYRVRAAVEGAGATTLAETTQTRLAWNAERGGTEWWVDAVFDACPPASSPHAHFFSNGTGAPFAVSDFAGQPGVFGASDGALGEAAFESPSSLGIDSYGNMYIADTRASTIRTIPAGGGVSTIAGQPNATGASDGTASLATFNHPAALAVSQGGYVQIADTGNQLIRQLYPTGNGVFFGPLVATIAGSAGVAGIDDGPNSAARFSAPSGIAVTPGYVRFIADSGSDRIRSMTQTFVVTSVAGVAGSPGTKDGPGAFAQFHEPSGLVVDAAGNVYIADTQNNAIRRLSAGGTVTTLAGAPGIAGLADGIASAARFNHPTALAFDSLGNLYIADSGNHAIRRMAPSLLVTTVIGTGIAGHRNGDGITAQLDTPLGVAFDANGRLFIADSGNHVIRMAVPAIAPVPVNAVPVKRRAVQH